MIKNLRHLFCTHLNFLRIFLNSYCLIKQKFYVGKFFPSLGWLLSSLTLYRHSKEKKIKNKLNTEIMLHNVWLEIALNAYASVERRPWTNTIDSMLEDTHFFLDYSQDIQPSILRPKYFIFVWTRIRPGHKQHDGIPLLILIERSSKEIFQMKDFNIVFI